MGAINVTLAKKTDVTIPTGGNPFHFWTMRVPESSAWTAVFLDYGGPGPVEPYRVPSMFFDAMEDGMGYQACIVDGVSRDNMTVYFQRQFPC